MWRPCLHVALRILLVVALGAVPLEARSAESLSAAVDEIATRLVASQVGAKTPVRVAVNMFSHPDNQATQFSQFLMVALTGKMVELGGAQVRVIERAQLESALRELELGDVPLFDEKTAKDLGHFLNVDALVVGELTTLTDIVRIDARLVAVDTVETLVAATAWVPLTPTVQRQLDERVVVARPIIRDGEGPDPRNGIWRGEGSCGDAAFGLAVAMIFQPDDTITAMQSYFPLDDESAMEAGVLAMEGTYDPATQSVLLDPAGWLVRPSGHTAIGITGTLDVEAGRLQGSFTNEACGEVMLTKQ